MNAIIHNFQNELTPAERQAFAAKARRAGRRPGAQLKALIFGEAAAPIKKAKPQKQAP